MVGVPRPRALITVLGLKEITRIRGDILSRDVEMLCPNHTVLAVVNAFIAIQHATRTRSLESRPSLSPLDRTAMMCLIEPLTVSEAFMSDCGASFPLPSICSSSPSFRQKAVRCVHAPVPQLSLPPKISSLCSSTKPVPLSALNQLNHPTPTSATDSKHVPTQTVTEAIVQERPRQKWDKLHLGHVGQSRPRSASSSSSSTPRC
jgi:hypothetical protein